MIVADFIEWLKTQDQQATVEVVCRERGHGHNGDGTTVKGFDPAQHAEYVDLRNKQFVTDPVLKTKHFLQLGES